MIYKNQWALNFLVMLVFCFGFFVRAHGASQEIRPESQMAGTIVSPMEERKQALSTGEKVFVSLSKTIPVKKGDILEIFQQNTLTMENNKTYPFSRAGQVIVLEIINEHLLLCVIDSSIQEIAVGDRLYYPEP